VAEAHFKFENERILASKIIKAIITGMDDKLLTWAGKRPARNVPRRQKDRLDHIDTFDGPNGFPY